MKPLVAILATFLAPASVSAADSFDQGPNGLNCAFCAPLEFDRLVVLLGDDKLREVVCRLSFQPFTPGKLSSAIGLPEGQVLRRIKTLQGWGVVRLVWRDSATTVVEPHAGGGGRTLRRWAKKYCPLGNECGRPTGETDVNRYSYTVDGGQGSRARDNQEFDPEYNSARDRLVATIQDEMLTTMVYTGRSRLSQRVLEAISKTPRHEFVPPELRDQAYDNHPLPIAGGQTISQPYIVALMTEILDVKPTDVVLEIGTGSGYQAAVLAALAKKIYSIEIVKTLHREASERLRRLGYRNVDTRLGDGYSGLPEVGPFNAIIVTAAAERIPEPLLRQLAPGGRMAVVVGEEYGPQLLFGATV